MISVKKRKGAEGRHFTRKRSPFTFIISQNDGIVIRIIWGITLIQIVE